MATEKARWADAGPFLARVFSDLGLGELVHGENFSLFEAMSALEIMDPKMDAGMSTAGFRNAQEAIAGGIAPIDLSLPQILDVMDHLMACEATWHEGSSLAQTVFTCIYLLDVDRTAPNPILHSHCKAVRATCNVIRTLACKAEAREEEDFVTASFGLPLEGDTDSKSLAGLVAIEELYARKLKGTKAGSSKNKFVEGQAESIVTNDEEPVSPELCRALLSRIRFRKALFYALANLENPQGKGIELAKKHLGVALTELSSIRSTSASLQVSKLDSQSGDLSSKNTFSSSVSPSPSPSPSPSSSTPPPLSSSLPNRSSLDNTSKLSSLELKESSAQPSKASTQVAGNGDVKEEANGISNREANEIVSREDKRGDDVEVNGGFNREGNGGVNGGVSISNLGGCSTASGRRAVGFDEMVNRSLLAPTPPRPMRIVGWLEALDQFEKLICDLQRACSIPLSSPSLQDLQQFLIDFQGYRPGPIARCHLQQLVSQWGQENKESKDKENKEIKGREEEAYSTTIFQTLKLPFEKDLRNDSALCWFTFRAKQVEAKFLRALTGNLSRQRRDLSKLLVDWNDLIQEAEVAGGSPALAAFVSSNYPQGWWGDSLLISWGGEQACRVIWQCLMLGFHTQLYSPSEYCAIYWYLDHALSTLVHNVEARERAWWEKEHRLVASADSGKDKKSRRKKGVAGGGVAKEKPSPFRGSVDLALIRCHLDLCKALVRMLVALAEDKKLGCQGTPYNSQKERFEQRVEALGRSHIPEPMNYSAYKRGTDISGLRVVDVYQMAYELFQAMAANVHHLKERTELDSGMTAVSREQRVTDILRMEQVASRNCLALQLAHRAGPGPTLKVSFDFSLHPCFPVTVLKRS